MTTGKLESGKAKRKRVCGIVLHDGCMKLMSECTCPEVEAVRRKSLERSIKSKIQKAEQAASAKAWRAGFEAARSSS
jgi:hypothetical protein